MSAIDDLIAQVGDAALRQRLEHEWSRAREQRKFGLVFEEHLPELLVLPSARVRRGSAVCLVADDTRTVWRVQRVEGQQAYLRRSAGGEQHECTAALDALQVVRQFGDPIFPALEPVARVQNGAPDAPWHTLIEADNYHALQLLDYLYAGQVDCIYIDPPYNTGARDWKYNNDYVDDSDSWRHSKWLAFMERRLKLARRLLRPDNGVLVVTIDEHEVHHLGMLLERCFPECVRQMVTIVINQKGVAQGRFARAEEYALYSFNGAAGVATHHDDLLSPERSGKRFETPRWEWLLRGGTNSRREDRPGLFYPVYVDPEIPRITGVGEPLPLEQMPDLSAYEPGTVAWPIRTDGSLGNWRVGPPSFMELVEQGYAKLGGYDKNRGTWTILYLGQKARQQIRDGTIEIVARDPETQAVEVEYTERAQRYPKTVWHRPLHDSGVYGSALLRSILGGEIRFSFPKSIYSTHDAIAAIVRDRPHALILDFFAGSGTTLNAINLLNAVEGGRRRCILVTNNELSGNEADALARQGFAPGEPQWEAQGICQSVTWPRSKYTLLGRRDDGTPLPGDYRTGRTQQVEKRRQFQWLGFVDASALNTNAKRKQLVALIDGLPQTLVQTGVDFIVSAEHDASVLFDAEAADDWLQALEGQAHIRRFCVVAPRKRDFDAIRARVDDLLGPYTVSEEELRPLAQGFAANLEYFRLQFLQPERVRLRRAFAEILPLLWLKAGAVGPRPELPTGQGLPELLLPADSNFAVLLDETRLQPALPQLARAEKLAVVYLVTDDEDAFRAMGAAIAQARGPQARGLQSFQLYSDYLSNFSINRTPAGAGEPA